MTRADYVRNVESYLCTKVVGQGEALSKISRALEASEFRLNDSGRRPRGVYLFMGPSGVGKTSTSKAFAEYLGKSLSMIYMNQLQSPSDTIVFADAIRRGVEANADGTVFLLDEIEKAHKSIIDILLSLLDEGEIAFPDGSSVMVSHCYVVLTSNIGAEKWGDMRKTKYAIMDSFAREQAKRKLRPELFYRINEVVVYRPLDQDTQIEILDMALAKKLVYVQERFATPLTVEPRVKAHLLRQCFTQVGGARNLTQELDRQINSALIPWIDSVVQPSEHTIYYDCKNDTLILQ